MSAAALAAARDYALTGGGSGMVLRSGRVVLEWGDLGRRYDLKSSTKSIGAMVLGLALGDGKVRLSDRAADHHPAFGVPPDANSATGWLGRATLLHLATQTAGFAKPGGYEPLLFEPGTAWAYSDGGPNWLAECLTLAYGRDLRDLLFERVLGPIGIAPEGLEWRANAYRPAEISGIPRREFGSGISASVDAMARIGYLHLRRGRWGPDQILPADFVDLARVPHPTSRDLPVAQPEVYGAASSHYGLLWWNNADGTLAQVPRDAYWSWGLYDSLIVVIPSLDLVAARAGGGWERRPEWSAHYDVLRPFLAPVAESVVEAAVPASAPCPPSRTVVGIAWAPPQSIARWAEGSDNWPSTQLRDGSLLVAWGDGHGFEPGTPEKLSLGLARVQGRPPDLHGRNLRSSVEQRGDGADGAKASGLLRVGDRLYALLRNVANSRLAWSDDQGATWDLAPWRFETSFGCPTFVSAAPDADEFVYVCSPDSEDAYTPAGRMVIGRAPADRLDRQDALEVYAGMDARGVPQWSSRVEDRAAVIDAPGRCYRSGVTYASGLARYLWCATVPGAERDQVTGLAVYEAPEPWGPWRAVYYAEAWDAPPGDSAHFPASWLTPDGRQGFLLHSGTDAFSVREAQFVVRPAP